MSKFNVGDRVKILHLDEISNDGMAKYIGQIGIVKDIHKKEKGEVTYAISFESYNHVSRWWFKESSLKFKGRKSLININEVWCIITNIKEEHPEVKNILDEIIYKIGGLPCR